MCHQVLSLVEIYYEAGLLVDWRNCFRGALVGDYAGGKVLDVFRAGVGCESSNVRRYRNRLSKLKDK